MSHPPTPDGAVRLTVTDPYSLEGPTRPSWLKKMTSSSRSRDEDATRRTKEIASNALSGLQTVTSLAAEAVKDAGIPGLGIGLSVLSATLEKIQTMSSTIDGLESLAERITKLRILLEEFGGRRLPEFMQKRIVGLFREWDKISEGGKTLKDRNAVMRFLRSATDEEELGRLVGKFNDSFQNFQFEAILNVEAAVHNLADDIKLHQDETFMPPYAQFAVYDANDARGGCLDGTRVNVLGGIWNKISEATSSMVREQDEEQPMRHGTIIWVNGQAGTGKTTIAYSLAEKCAKEQKLAASFFSSRFDVECSNIGLIVPSIARQLARFHAPFKEKVVAAKKENPDIVKLGLARQLEELIIKPLQSLPGPFPASAIVIDALDELSDPGATTTLLKILAQFIHHLFPFIFVITSRPEPHITAAFDKSHTETLGSVTTQLVLHEISLEEVTADIKVYFERSFEEIRLQWEIQEEWPFAGDMAALTELAHGLFIFASTALRFIKDLEFRDPVGQLQLLLDRKLQVEGSPSILDELYCQIIKLSYQKISPGLARRLRTILGAITLCQRPLSVSTFAGLLGISASQIRTTLSGLHSVLYIPDDATKPIRVLHPTFLEFLLRSSPPRHDAFYIQPAEQHCSLLLQCLAVTDVLKRNVIDIKAPGTTLTTEIPDLSQRVSLHIPLHLQYACEYWSAHLRLMKDAPTPADALEPTQVFMKMRLLFWLEACVWLGKFDAALTSLDEAWQACQTLGGAYAELVPLLRDCRRFALAYIDCVRMAPLEMYRSALAVAPQSSILAQTYRHELGQLPHLEVKRGALADWGPCLATFAAHGGDAVYAVSFSPSGSAFATGGKDGRVKIWETLTCTLLLSIHAHPNAAIGGVKYAANGAYIVTGSDDMTVRIWDASTGQRISTFDGHTGRVYSVQYSADGFRVLSATLEGELKLWNVSDGSCVLTLHTDGESTFQAAISSDGMCIAHGANDALCLYHVPSKTVETLDLQGNVRVAAFSPGDSYVAVCTPSAIHIWTLEDRALVRSIDVHQQPLRLAFSADGGQIGCGFGDGSIRLWDDRSEEPSQILTGHTSAVYDIAWSPDNSRIVSAGYDGTVRVWDGTLPPTIPHANANVQTRDSASLPRYVVAHDRAGNAISVFRLHSSIGAFKAPDDAPLLTCCPDGITAWDAALHPPLDSLVARHSLSCLNSWARFTGQNCSQLGLHTITFSDDGELVAYRSETSDSVIQVCSLRTGQPNASFLEHDNPVASVAFSPASAHLATGSQSGRVVVWSVASGARITSCNVHTDRVSAIAPSSESRYVLSGSWDKTARVFDMDSNKVLHTLEHDTWVENVAFAAGDVHIITQDGVDQLYIWDLTTGTRVTWLRMHSNFDLQRFNYSADGTSAINFDDNDTNRHTILVRKDHHRAWPAHFIDESGWIYTKDPWGTRRIAWLPPEWRIMLPSENQQLCVYDASQQTVVVIDVSQLTSDPDDNVS